MKFLIHFGLNALILILCLLSCHCQNQDDQTQTKVKQADLDCNTSSKYSDNSILLSRKKRAIVFPEGSSLQLGMIVIFKPNLLKNLAFVKCHKTPSLLTLKI